MEEWKVGRFLGSSELSVENENILGHVDIYVRRVHNSPISPYRRGEVRSLWD